MSAETPKPANRVVARRYLLERRIGEGNMGEVWAARHVVTRAAVAVKLMLPHIGKDERGVERFLREVQVVGRIDHPGVVSVYDAGRDEDGSLYIAMELLIGRSFGVWVKEENPSLGEVLEVMCRLLEALAATHIAGVVHRDIKPDNIFVLDGPGRRVKLLDFGIARHVEGANTATRTGFTVGTPYYMSPEQAVDPRKCGPSSDVWSVGAMLYELVTGHPPFEGETATAVCLAAVQEPHRPVTEEAPMVPAALVHLVDRCLEKAAAKRPPDAAAVLAELRPIVDALATGPRLAVARPRTETPRGDGAAEGADGAWADTGLEDTGLANTGLAESDRLPSDRRRWVVLGAALLAAASVLIFLGLRDPKGDSGGPDRLRAPASVPANRVADAGPPIAPPPVQDAAAKPPARDAGPPDAAPRAVMDAAPAPVDAAAPPTVTDAPRPRPVAPRTAPKPRAPQTDAPPTSPPPAPVTAAPITAAPVTQPPAAPATRPPPPPPSAPPTAAPRTVPSAAPTTREKKNDPAPFTF